MAIASRHVNKSQPDCLRIDDVCGLICLKIVDVGHKLQGKYVDFGYELLENEVVDRCYSS